jgi:UDP-N-acetylmuramoyl-tripeptide--D-alanyl-D-alanine ligase
MQLTGREIADVTGGAWSPEQQGQALAVSAVSTDTRTLAPGDLFVALEGERFDAHDYVDQAIERGACGLVVHDTRQASGGPPLLTVADTLTALGDMAAAWRSRCPARRTAIIGSSGKTTTKGMLGAIVCNAGAALVSPSSFNNLIGLPLSLLSLLPSHDDAVLELGMNEPGELGRLARIADPDVLLVVNVGCAHIGRFESHQALLEAKGEALRELRSDATIVYNRACEDTREIVRRWGAERPRVTFAVEQPADVQAAHVEPLPSGGYRFELIVDGGSYAVELALFGRYNVANAVAAAAAAHVLGVDADAIAEELGRVRLPSMRSEVRRVAGVTLIADCYNANPDSMRAALESIADWPGASSGRTFLVLGDMLELGEETGEHHRSVGDMVARMPISGLYVVGEHTPALVEACSGAGFDTRHFDDHEPLARCLIEQLRPGDTVFFKASRRNFLERAVEKVAKSLPTSARSDGAHRG